MILNKELIEKKQLGETLNYIYPMSFGGEQKYGVISISGTSSERQIQVYIATDKKTLQAVDDEVFQSNDIQKSWEKFEELFNQSDEGKDESGGNEPEVASLYLTFALSGASTLFLQNQSGEQKVLMEFEITDTDLIIKQPRFYALDFTNDPNMPEQLQTKWAMANTNGDVKLEGKGDDYVTYQVAILSVAQPDGHTPPQPPSDNMEFYRLITQSSGALVLNKFLFNRPTKQEVFVEQTVMQGEDKGGYYEVSIGGTQMKLSPYPTLDANGQKAYVLVSEGENPTPLEEMPFYKFVSFVGGILNLKLHTYNLKTKAQTYIQDTQFQGEDKTDYYEVVLDGNVMKLMPYPFLSNATEKAYVMIMDGQDPPPPTPPTDNPPPPPIPTDEIEFFRLISDMGNTIIVSQNVFNKKTKLERMIRTLTYDSVAKGSMYQIQIEDKPATLVPYSKFDSNGQKAYKLIMKSDSDEEADDDENNDLFRFFRLISYNGSVLNLKQYLLNKTDNSESFEGDVTITAEDKGDYFEADIDGDIVRFGRIPKYDKDGFEAYVGVKKSKKSKSDDEDEDEFDDEDEDEDEDEDRPKRKKPKSEDDEDETDEGAKGRDKKKSRNEIINQIAETTGDDPNDIRGSFRSERFLESYLNNKNVNYAELGEKLNLPTSRGALLKEIMKIVNQK